MCTGRYCRIDRAQSKLKKTARTKFVKSGHEEDRQVKENRQGPRIVLVRPSHPGNIGAVARAMANMGLNNLYLVKPQEFPSEVATARAASATAVLDAAVVVDDLDAAIAQCKLIVGTTARDRTIDWPTQTPRQAAELLNAAPAQSALVFGNERTGLSNAEVDRCHHLVNIPVDEGCPSLNLAAAVMVMVYEYRMAMLVAQEDAGLKPTPPRGASADQLRGFYDHIEIVLTRIRFLKVHPPTKLMRKIVRLFNRAQITEEEVNILRGVLTTIEYEMDKRDGLR